jgi:hypothetical protein
VIKPGEEWGRPASSAPDVEVVGGDADLAAAVARLPGVLVRFRPDATSDLAGAVGLDRAVDLGVELDLDLLRLDDGPPPAEPVPVAVNMPLAVNMPVAVNMVVVGRPPDALGPWVRCFGANVAIDGRSVFHGPCTTIVVATGQFRNGLDVVPRGHPGDGRAEVQIYAVARRQRRELRNRLSTGTHVPHPGITQRSGSRVRVSIDRRVPVEIDGRLAPEADRVDISVVPGAYRLLL